MRGYITCKRWQREGQEPGNNKEQLPGPLQGDDKETEAEPCIEEIADHHHHILHPQHHPGADKAVTPACRDRMPGSIAQASPGGTCPMTDQLISVSNQVHFDKGKGAGAETVEPGGDQEDSSLRQDDHQGEEDSQDDYRASKEGQHDHHNHSLPLQHHHHGADKAVTPACTNRMPGPRVQASPGGTCPRTVLSLATSNPKSVENVESKEDDHTEGQTHRGDEGDQEPLSSHQHHPRSEVEEIAAKAACINRMPGPKVQASPGGICPRTSNLSPSSNIDTAKESEAEEMRTPIYVTGATEAENKAYSEFLMYMEKKREEAKELLEEDEQRKSRYRKKRVGTC